MLLLVGLLAGALLAVDGSSPGVPAVAEPGKPDVPTESNALAGEAEARAQAVRYLQQEAGYSEAAANRFIDQQHEQLSVLASLHDQMDGVVGGAYFDHEREGILVVRVPAGESSAVHDALAPLLDEASGLEGRVELIPARASLAAMTEASDQLVERFLAVLSRNWSVGYDPRPDQVVVTVPPDDLESALEIAAEITASMLLPADTVTVTASDEEIIDIGDACTSSQACDPPARGGLRFQKCSAGFMADNTNGGYYTITAGHCGSGNYSTRHPLAR
jgi:hypothetical protein